MNKYKKIIETAKELITSIEMKDKELMAVKMDQLEHQYKYDFGDSLNSYEAVYAYF